MFEHVKQILIRLVGVTPNTKVQVGLPKSSELLPEIQDLTPDEVFCRLIDA